jgi:NADH dehydrogenase
MSQRILIVGSGFAGVWSALGAARVLDGAGKADGSVEIMLIAPQPTLHLRPRLHEAKPYGMTQPLLPLLEAVGVRYVQGSVEQIHAGDRCVQAVDADGARFTIEYDKLVLTTGSKLFQPAVPGLREYAFSVDQWDDATELDTHIARLADAPASDARNTVVVVGGGFTGIEVACEMPERLHRVLGKDAKVRVLVVERAPSIGHELGDGPRPSITQAFEALGVESKAGVSVTSIDAGGVTLSTGERIAAQTVIWTGGMRASALTEQIGAPRDALGRLEVSRELKVQGQQHIFAAGDVAHAALDDEGNYALMSCQHAIDMGRYAGHNVAADLLGFAPRNYQQAFYVTCLDLGSWGAVYTEGWEREPKMVGAEAKALKVQINTEWIYAPPPSRTLALSAAEPSRSVVA